MASSTSIFTSSLTPKTLIPSKLQTQLTPNFLVSFPFSTKRVEPLTTRFVPCVSVSSEYGQQGQDQEEEREQKFSADLKLFVGNLPFNVDSSELAGLFGTAGTVEMVEVIYDKITGRSRGFGFVTMSSAEEVKFAAEKFNGYELEGRPLRVNAGPPPPKRDNFGPSGGGGGGEGRSFDSPNRLYVGNLSWQVDDLALKNLFSESGDVADAKVIYDRDTGRSRGFGFVTYKSEDDVKNAIENLDGVDFNGRSIRVTVAESKPRRF